MRIRKRYAVKYFTAVVSFRGTGRIKPLCNDAIKHRIENFRLRQKRVGGKEKEKKIQRRLTKNKFANSTNPLATGPVATNVKQRLLFEEEGRGEGGQSWPVLSVVKLQWLVQSKFFAYRRFYEWLIQSFTSRFVFPVGGCNAPARLLRVRVTSKSTPIMHRTTANNGKEEVGRRKRGKSRVFQQCAIDLRSWRCALTCVPFSLSLFLSLSRNRLFSFSCNHSLPQPRKQTFSFAPWTSALSIGTKYFWKSANRDDWNRCRYYVRCLFFSCFYFSGRATMARRYRDAISVLGTTAFCVHPRESYYLSAVIFLTVNFRNSYTFF